MQSVGPLVFVGGGPENSSGDRTPGDWAKQESPRNRAPRLTTIVEKMICLTFPTLNATNRLSIVQVVLAKHLQRNKRNWGIFNKMSPSLPLIVVEARRRRNLSA
jgi:hypothetical protein